MWGGVSISIDRRVAAHDVLMNDIGTSLMPEDAWLVIDYAAWRFERDEIEGALKTLQNACDLTGAIRLGAVMHVGAVHENARRDLLRIAGELDADHP